MGDPNEDGIFGIQDCMGRIRNGDYDAVIGIGGNSPWKGHTEIKYKINWIGLEPKKRPSSKRGKEIVFAHFDLYEEKGIDIRENYKSLFNLMYGKRLRFKTLDTSADLPENLLEEVKEILDSIKDSRPSKAYNDESNDTFETNINPKTSKCRSCG